MVLKCPITELRSSSVNHGPSEGEPPKLGFSRGRHIKAAQSEAFWSLSVIRGVLSNGVQEEGYCQVSCTCSYSIVLFQPQIGFPLSPPLKGRWFFFPGWGPGRLGLGQNLLFSPEGPWEKGTRFPHSSVIEALLSPFLTFPSDFQRCRDTHLNFN